MMTTRCESCRYDVGAALASKKLCPVCTPIRLRTEAPEFADRLFDEEEATELLDDE
jgi:hypothetical protein